MNTPLLEVIDLACAYREQPVASGLNFRVEAGEIACLLGPSGCGKTTILRAIAGFIPVMDGLVTLNGCVISNPGFTLPPEKRQMGMVFQDYALFPHLSVADNICFGLPRSSQRKETVVKMLELVQLPDLSKRYPHELSGGQQQRVALARALAPKPALLLMDEPFSNLDTDLRQQLSLEVRDILKAQQIAAIVVTHDQQEAFTIGDSIGVVADGLLQQWGTPEQLYHHPANYRVADFVGRGELFAAHCQGDCRVATELGVLEFAEPCCGDGAETMKLFIRPTDIHPVHGGDQAEVLSVEFLGDRTRLNLRLASGRVIQATCNDNFHYSSGQWVGVRVSHHKPILFRE